MHLCLFNYSIYIKSFDLHTTPFFFISTQFFNYTPAFDLRRCTIQFAPPCLLAVVHLISPHRVGHTFFFSTVLRFWFSWLQICLLTLLLTFWLMYYREQICMDLVSTMKPLFSSFLYCSPRGVDVGMHLRERANKFICPNFYRNVHICSLSQHNSRR